MGVSLSYVSELRCLPLALLPFFFPFGFLPLSFHHAPIFNQYLSPKISQTIPSLPTTSISLPSLISKSGYLSIFFPFLIRHHGLILALTSRKRNLSHPNLKTGGALAWVHAPPPSMFCFRGLLAPCVMCFLCLALFSEMWLQIKCDGGDDELVSRSFVFFWFFFSRVILLGLWCRGLFSSSNMESPFANSTTTPMVGNDGTGLATAGLVAAEEDEKFRTRVFILLSRLN